MNATEYVQKQKEYWEAMPDWVKAGFNKDPIINSIVMRCLHSDVPAGELVSHVGEFFYHAHSELMERECERAANSVKGILL